MRQAILAHGYSVVNLQVEATSKMRVYKRIVRIVGIGYVIKGEIRYAVTVSVVIRHNILWIRPEGQILFDGRHTRSQKSDTHQNRSCSYTWHRPNETKLSRG